MRSNTNPTHRVRKYLYPYNYKLEAFEYGLKEEKVARLLYNNNACNI